MSLARITKLPRVVGLAALLWCLLPALCQAQGCPSCVAAPGSACGGGACNWLHCPPAYRHCRESPPCIIWHCGCPHPVCNPCDLQHFGYFETLWYPWPFPPTMGVPPTPSNLVTLNPYLNPNMPPSDLGPRIGPPTGISAPRGPVPPTGMMPSPTYPGAMPLPGGDPLNELPPPRTLPTRPGY